MIVKKENGYTTIDIAISVIVIFIFISLIATIVYNFNSSSKEIELKSKAIDLAMDEIEKIKTVKFEEIENRSERANNSQYIPEDSTKEIEEIENNEGFFRRVIIQDYNDIEPNRVPGIVKKITVQISYVFKGKYKSIELSSLKTKEI